jgi:prepilin-type N-terminal cleavage/methylation domain-containing protein
MHAHSSTLVPRARAARGGFTMLEVTVVMVVIAVALGMFASTLGSLSGLGQVNRETSLAIEAARSVAERLRAVDLTEVHASFNADPDDDPLGAGTADGATFSVAGLKPPEADPDGLVGQVLLPTLGGIIREDMDWPELGFPRDLNADGLIDSVDHSLDSVVIPLVIRIEWEGRTGVRSHDLFVCLGANG